MCRGRVRSGILEDVLEVPKRFVVAAQMTVRDALNSALDEEMSADSKVFVIGEEVWTCTHCLSYVKDALLFPFLLLGQ